MKDTETRRLMRWLTESLRGVGLDAETREDPQANLLILRFKEKGIAISLAVIGITTTEKDMAAKYPEYCSGRHSPRPNLPEILDWLASYVSLKDGIQVNAAGQFLYLEILNSRYSPIYFVLIDSCELSLSY